MIGRVILDLCGGTGSWSKPYIEAGYDVRVITMPEQDVRLFQPPDNVHGVLAAPPCTYFCTMRRCRGPSTNEQLLLGLSVVDACIRIVYKCQPKWWALENPTGDLHKYLGKPRFGFQPCDFGDPWTKKTLLWGDFEMPLFSIGVEPKFQWVNSGRNKKSPARNTRIRSITPPSFAKAFFKANP